MGFELYFQCFGKDEKTGISREAVRSLFPIVEAKSELDYWRVQYDEKNSCDIGVTALASDNAKLSGLYVNRPCGDVRLWESVLAILKMGSVVLFWPGGPPIVTDEKSEGTLPKEMVESIGQAKVARSAEQLLEFLRES